MARSKAGATPIRELGKHPEDGEPSGSTTGSTATTSNTAT